MRGEGMAKMKGVLWVLASKREVIRFSKSNKDRKLRDARGL